MHKQGYVIQADVIRIFAILGVVLTHVVYSVYARPDYLGGATWWLANLINAIAHTSVPLFIMLSGYLLLPKKEVGSVVQRIVRRLLIPLLVWFGVYLWWNMRRHNAKYELLEIASMVFRSNMFLLYFLVILIGLYALVPLLQVYVIPNVKRLERTIVLSTIAGFCMFLAPYFLTNSEAEYNSFTIWIPYLSYFLLGYWFSTHKIQALRLWVIFLITYAATVAFGYLNVRLRGMGLDILWSPGGVSYFDEYLSPNIFLMSVSLFPLLLNSSVIGRLKKSTSMARIIPVLSGATFAVYLLHSFVIDKIDIDHGYAMEFLKGPLLPYFITRTSLIVVISFIVSIIAVRIPYFQMLFGIWPTQKKEAHGKSR